MTFPSALGAWNPSCKSQGAADSSGNPVHVNCDDTSVAKQVDDTDIESELPVAIGEITAGSSWGFCVDVTVPGGYSGPRLVQWGLSGDEEPGSALPHDVSGALTIERCMPVTLFPSTRNGEGCNGVPHSYEVELWYNAGSGGVFGPSYGVPTGNGVLSGPDGFDLGAGDVVTCMVQLEPELCLEPGQEVQAAVSVARSGSPPDEATIHHTVTEFAGWQGRAPSPVATMDNVVVWASQADGGLWSIGGHGAEGATQRYDPAGNTWITHTREMSPAIAYAMDGCYGLKQDGDEIVVLFPDTIVTGTLHVYNITHDTWYMRPVPAFYPLEGRWGQDIVSLLNVPGVHQIVCYLTGGSTREGGGRTRDLWRYEPASNAGQYIDHFPDENCFYFHAAWFVPWVGSGDGAICMAGGIDLKSNVVTSSQCYDIAADAFLTGTQALGPLPEPWWGMADGWQIHDGRYQIWLANGVSQDGRLLPLSAYADETTGGFVSGPGMPVALYRTEGDGWEGQFYTLGRSAGGFNYSPYTQMLARCPVCFRFWAYLPLGVRD